MTLSDIEAVRLKTSDRAVLRRSVWEADGEASDIKLEFEDVTVISVYREGSLLVPVTDYVVGTTNGLIHINALPAVNTIYSIEYSAVVFTDPEIQFFIDEASGNTTLASAFMLYAWSANAAKLAKKESAQGGGGFGAVTLDTAVRAKELRESAKGYAEQYQLYAGQGLPVEMLTQVGWTDETRRRQILRHILGLDQPS